MHNGLDGFETGSEWFSEALILCQKIFLFGTARLQNSLQPNRASSSHNQRLDIPDIPANWTANMHRLFYSD